ncbi:MAG: DUF883 domain-containing protein [Sinobacteraceae bacterium]|nr:DUF883 domain-containing protein [Nevskiaceae bacterium]MBV9912088.1 DUF883 domain-containing protein [Nevskiaceae bacterium]
MTAINVGKLADDLQTLVGDAEELLRATANSAGDKASEARERAEESLRAVRARLASVERDLRGRARVVGDYVEDNPWQAIAVAGGIALILGLLMGRK